MTVVVGERGMRAEYSKAYTVVPAGGALIVAPDGGLTVINTAARTYWKSGPAASALKPTVTLTPSGESATIAGVAAERSGMEIRIALPMAAGMPGLPSELVMTGDAWFAPQYKNYAAMSGGLSSFGAVALDKAATPGLLMRSIMRSDLFGGKEIEGIVTSIGEVDVPAGTFEVPAGFTQVDPPATPVGLPGR
jgi:hypothetical protein